MTSVVRWVEVHRLAVAGGIGRTRLTADLPLLSERCLLALTRHDAPRRVGVGAHQTRASFPSVCVDGPRAVRGQRQRSHKTAHPRLRLADQACCSLSGHPLWASRSSTTRISAPCGCRADPRHPEQSVWRAAVLARAGLSVQESAHTGSNRRLRRLPRPRTTRAELSLRRPHSRDRARKVRAEAIRSGIGKGGQTHASEKVLVRVAEARGFEPRMGANPNRISRLLRVSALSDFPWLAV